MCNHVSSDNRPERSKFKCVKCGHEGHADVIAATNIRDKWLRLVKQEQDRLVSSNMAVGPTVDVELVRGNIVKTILSDTVRGESWDSLKRKPRVQNTGKRVLASL
jgi:hypothetical protein